MLRCIENEPIDLHAMPESDRYKCPKTLKLPKTLKDKVSILKSCTIDDVK